MVQLGQSPRHIDRLTTTDGAEFEACFARPEQVELAGVHLNIIGLGFFKTNKPATGRLKDLADLESLGALIDSDSKPKPGPLGATPPFDGFIPLCRRAAAGVPTPRG